MLGQYHTADPYPNGIKAYQRGQELFVAGPYKCQTGKQSKKEQPPYLNAKYQARHNDKGLGGPAGKLYCIIVCPVFTCEPHAIAVTNLVPTTVGIDNAN